jgi:phosphonopyruvate decarboxylase
MTQQIFSSMRHAGVQFVTGVPDSLLKSVIESFDAEGFEHVRAANEGTAVAIATGWGLVRNSTPLVYMQNSGIGNAVSPLMSLAHKKVYGRPMILLIGWRGRPGHKDEPQHIAQGEAMIPMLDSMGIPYRVLENASDQSETDSAFQEASAHYGPFAILVGPKSIAPQSFKSELHQADRSLDWPTKGEYLEILLSAKESDYLYVSTTGFTSREAYVHFKSKQALDQLVMNVGAMGHAISISLGLALAQPKSEIFCLDGDGSMAMHLGGLAGLSQIAPKNLTHLVFNNLSHESVGGEPTVLAGMHLSAIARDLRYKTTVTIQTTDELRKVLLQVKSQDGPHFIELLTKVGVPESLPRPSEPLVDLLNLVQSRVHEAQLPK